MIPHYQTLRQRIAQEWHEIERTIDVIKRHWAKALRGGPDQDAFVNSVALNLHSLYAGLERIFHLIAVEIDGGVLGGESWHKELLRQMTLDIPGVRPAVLNPETAAILDEYRRFRHLIRNIYATNIDPARIKALVRQLDDLHNRVATDLERFTKFLDRLSRADEE